ncbi:hypothetical protein [Metabacillus idriensis]|uniref:hypothetical protein n=1 Tax=Metabacillus idriensis TaxID=324768 RepID=UPI00174B2B27|nr:hypothetical protein [Metabacillus idriensis]
MKILFRLSLVLLCSLYLIPASEDWTTGKPSLVIYDENGNVVDKLVDKSHYNLFRGSFFIFVAV